MNLPELSVKRPVTVIMMTLIVIILGGVSLGRLPIDLLPAMEIPVAIISTEYPGVGPQEVEEMITNPLEGAVATVEKIDTVSSMTTEGRSMVIAQFNNGTDMNFAALQMREKIDLVKRMFPSDVGAPMVLKIDPNAMPVITLSLSSKEGDLTKLQAIAEDNVKPKLERLEGVASVEVTGGYENQVLVRTHLEKMKGYGLSIDYLSKVIGAENLNAPGGKVEKGNQELTIRTTGEFQTIDEIKQLLISLPMGGQVRLQDVAEVALQPKELTAITKTDGDRSISISIQKRSGTNTVKVADAVNAEVVELQQAYPELMLRTVMDQSVYIKQSIHSIRQEAIIGGLLAVLVIYLFFHNLRTTFITATAIPIAVMATFAVLYFAGISINLMTLSGLTLAMGRLVDDNIVALENIYRHRKEGYSKAEAAIKGVKEVGMAITASTLTTLSVFLPIVFVEGITAILFKELALTVCISLAASLIVSLTLVPALSAKILEVGEGPELKRTGLKGLFDRFNNGFDRGFSGLETRYRKLLGWGLSHRKKVMIISTLIFLLSGASMFNVGAEFFPSMDSGQFAVNITLPDGAELKDTEAIVTQVEKELEGIKEIKSVFTSVGSGGAFSMGGSQTTNIANITVQLVGLKERQRGVKVVADEVRKLVKDIPGAELKIAIQEGFSMGGSTTPINVSVKGDDLDQLKLIGTDFQKLLKSVEGTREVKTNLTEGIPEVKIQIDRENASQYGITAGQIAQAVKGTLSGTIATRYSYEGKEINVVIEGDKTFGTSLPNLEQTPISTPAGITVPLSQVAQVSIDRGPTVINRMGQTRVVSITSEIINRDLKSMTTDIQNKLATYKMPEGYSYEMGGQNEEMTQAFGDLGMALILAIVLVYMILASQFESLIHPFTIILSLPMGLSGGMLGLFITRTPLSVPAFIGMILLTGVVVNNAIVLVDYIIKRRQRGEERAEAVQNAGPIRLRPIIMTTLTTALGLVPMALGIGEGAESQAPMAIVVIFGLMLSTVSTLVLVPVIYTIFDDWIEAFKRKSFRLSKFSRQV